MAADITTLTVIGNQATNLRVSSSDVTVINTVDDITILNAVSATITIPNEIELSNATPQEISSEVGSPGVSMSAARADHVHSAANLIVNGGNF